MRRNASSVIILIVMTAAATEHPAHQIARTIRDNALDRAATLIAAMLRTESVEWIATVGELASMLGCDSLLVLDVAFADATEQTGLAAARCRTGSWRRRAHLARFEVLCAAHDAVLAAVRV